MAVPALALNYDRTKNAGISRTCFKVAIGAAGAVGTITQASAGFVSSVTRTDTGRYTVQLAVPYPATLVYINPVLSLSSADAASLRCSYKQGSYSAAAGTFEINVADVDDIDISGDPETATLAYSAVDPENPSTIFVDMAYIE